MPRRRKPPRAGALTELQPFRLTGQIAALQALFYVAALALMLFTALVQGRAFALDLVFGWEAVRGDTTQGWLVAFVWVLIGGLVMSIAMVLIVARSKLVPDFALTTHFLHLLVVFFYTGWRIPTHLMWWFAMLASSGLAVSLGMWGCRYRELKPISFGGAAAAAAASGAAAGSSGGGGASGEEVQGDEEQGFSRGRGRGRGRDGAGEYEMVKMNGDAGHQD